MRYLATASSPAIRAAMAAGRLGCILAPGGGGLPPAGVAYALDNGRYGKGWPGEDDWWKWLTGNVARFDPALCLFATAPDVVADAAATLADSLPWLPRIRALGVPAAFVAQDGCSAPGLIPFGEFDVLFLGGTDDFKLGPEGLTVTCAARARGLPVHMGRVSSERRIRYAHALGCTSVDGTFLAFGPDRRLPEALAWLRRIHDQTPLWETA